MIYNFNKSLNESEKYEKFLDDYFQEEFKIKKVNMAMQRKGIDRIFVKNGKEYKIEYKTDLIAKKTGNVFIETISNDSNFDEGWVVKTQSDYIIYHCVDIDIFIVRSVILRNNLPLWIEKYPKKTCKNQTYNSHGRLVPIYEIRQISTVKEERR